MSAAADLLRRARERIATPERWTKGAFARDPADGYDRGDRGALDPDSCLCANGSLFAAHGDVGPPPYGVSQTLTRAARGRGFETVSKFNDAPETTHADVMALFDDAIALAESEVPR